ncbi:unnamed protein product [Chrysoparadoxa australica]
MLVTQPAMLVTQPAMLPPNSGLGWAMSIPALPQPSVRQSLMRLRMSNVDEETQRLLDAAAKARAEVAEMEKAMGMMPTSVKKVEAAKPPPPPPAPIKSTASRDEIIKGLSALSFDSPTSAASTLSELGKKGITPKWNSVSLPDVWPVSQGQLKNQAGLDANSLNPEGNLDDLKYFLGGVCLISAILAIGSGVIVGGNNGAALTYVFGFIPILTLGIGSTSPGIIALLVGVIKERLDPNYVDRRVKHEAAHLLTGYLLGLALKSYKTSGATTEVEFFDTVDGDWEGSLERKLTADEIKVMSVVALSGAVAEVKNFGEAQGAAGDLDNLGRLMNRAEDYMKPNVQQEQTRWGALEANSLLSKYKKEYDAVVEGCRRGDSLEEIIAMLELA